MSNQLKDPMGLFTALCTLSDMLDSEGSMNVAVHFQSLFAAHYKALSNAMSQLETKAKPAKGVLLTKVD